MIYIIIILICILIILFLVLKNIQHKKIIQIRKALEYKQELENKKKIEYQQIKQKKVNKVLDLNKKLKKQNLEKHFENNYTFPYDLNNSPVISLVKKPNDELIQKYNLNIEQIKMSDKLCYGNDFCNLQDLCIEQKCVKCGLRAPCSKDSDCGPNNCIKGCCDNM